MIISRELILTQTESGIARTNRFRNRRVGGQKVKELQSVLFVRLPNRAPPLVVSLMPIRGATDQTNGELATDRIVPIQFVSRHRIQIKANLTGIFPGLQIPADNFKTRRIVIFRFRHGNTVRGFLRQTKPEAVGHDFFVALLVLTSA